MYSYIIKTLSFIGILLFLNACEDKAIIKTATKKIQKEKIECMKLIVFPPNERIKKDLETLYPFSNTCPFNLYISYKSNIVCNSNQNSSTKAQGMPSAYLRLELKKDKMLLYSYYIDLDEALGTKQLEKGFSRLKKDLL